MKIRGLAIFLFFSGLALSVPAAQETNRSLKVFILPVREDIMPPMVYVIRRGVKEAMEAKADLLLLDMDTNGGRLDSTEEIIEILNQFKGQTATYVNRKAFSAGAFIAVATQKIYMAPQSIIGAAAPIMMVPGGGGAQDVPSSMEAKMNSALRGKVRISAQKNGHNPEVIEAMVDKNKQLVIDGKTLNEKGQILTLTNTEAEEKYGNPPRPLLSLATMDSMDAVINALGFGGAERVRIEPTGAEKLATWINAISPLLLIIGAIGIWLELKTPGFGLPGIVGIAAFVIYFLGGFVAGLSGMEWLFVFLLGLVLIIIELFAFPGTILIGLTGASLILVALIMGMVDIYPGAPSLPSFGQLEMPLRQMGIALLISTVLIAILARYLPKTSFYGTLVSSSASGVASVNDQAKKQLARIGEVGTTISALRPGGKARFGEQILDVMTQGEMVPKGKQVKIIGHSSSEAVVEVVG